jgi:SAM-dependent methyltransferase
LITPIPPDSSPNIVPSPASIFLTSRRWTGSGRGGPFETLLHDKLDTFDAIIASHVIEHLVDPIGFFNSAWRLLKEDRRVALAVPDKRLCFDCLRPVSTTGQLIATWRSKRRLHSLASVFDHSAYHA